MRFFRSIPFYIAAITATAVVREAPAKAEDAYTVKNTYYISSHPWGGCNAILRRESARKGDASKKNSEISFFQEDVHLGILILGHGSKN